MEKINVAVRVRPAKNNDSDNVNCWKVVENTVSLCSPYGTPVSGHTFAFDYVFGQDAKTSSIYELHTKGVIESALQGFNGTVFAYGQTSSGKTFTMRGSKDDLGLIALSVHEVFKHIEQIPDREFLIRVSYMEIYNEEINDLLAPENRKLQVHENLEKGIFVAGLREEIVSGPEHVFELLEYGEAQRHVGQTNMNLYSSRSHTIFRMVIESKDKDAHDEGVCPDAVRVSVLNLVDLAGSERAAKTGAGGVRLKEGSHINKSLMTLGNVIKKLSDGVARQGGHIPYRDSKLTRILQPALGGNAKTAIICTIAPEEVHIDETRGTLQFASRAKRVTTCAQVNEILTDAALLKRQQKEIEDLRNKLQGLKSDVSDEEILRLRNELLKYELEKEKLELALQEERKAHAEREQRIREQELRIENLSNLVSSNFDDSLNKENGKHLENRFPESTHQAGLITLRREKLQSPINFDLMSERGSDRKRKEVDFPEVEFENVADEDLWATMNDGQSLAEPDFLFATPKRFGSSFGSTRGTDSSIVGAPMSSKIKMDKYKAQLEEVQRENTDLRIQLQEQFSLQTELRKEITDLEKELQNSKHVARTMEECWNIIKHGKSFLSTVLSEFVATEKSNFQSALAQSFEDKTNQIEMLTDQVRQLEEEVMRYKAENNKLMSQCQSMAEQQLFGVSTPLSRRSKSQNAGSPFLSAEFSGDRLFATPRGRLSNGTFLSMREKAIGSDNGLSTKRPQQMDVLAGCLPEDHEFGVSDDDWLKLQGTGFITGRNRGYPLSTERGMNHGVSTDQNKMSEMLLMSKEHIRALERQVELANLEKERTAALLRDQMEAHEKSMIAMRLEKHRFAEDLKNIMESIAIQDNYVTSICHGIEEYDKGLDYKCHNLISQAHPLTVNSHHMT
uniref:Kinesin-like protein n=1 Tax=Marsilea vestita TaxID=59764 RepID=A0A142KWA8_MARVE|nr:kinesin 7-IV protein [Marsilea vestita]